jgi:hypothetical protein
VEKQNLWYHYKRFNNVISGIDPVKEKFVPFTFNQDSVRCYGIKGNTNTMIWCRDSRNNWKTELEQEILPVIKKNFSVKMAAIDNKNFTSAKAYNPWKDEWTKVEIENGTVILPPFLRSVVLILN